jgi:hypothetical protein
MYLFSKNRWSFTACKFWGGWAAGEKRDTLMKYIMDEEAYYESSFNDMLDPNREHDRYVHIIFFD